MATEEERGEKEGVSIEGIKIEKLEANSTNTSTTNTTTTLPSMSIKDLESTSTKTLVLGAPIIASPIRKPDLKVKTTKQITNFFTLLKGAHSEQRRGGEGKKTRFSVEAEKENQVCIQEQKQLEEDEGNVWFKKHSNLISCRIRTGV